MQIYKSELSNLYEEFMNEENGNPGNVRRILPQMIRISNNSQITNVTAQRIAERFNEAELRDFIRWMQLIEQETQIKINQNKKKFGRF